MGHLIRKTLFVAVAVAVMVGFVATFASAAAMPNRPAISFVSPSPAEGATVTADPVAFAFTSNRTPKQTKTLICTLASATTTSSSACDTPTAITGGSSSGKSYTGLASGSYTFTVSLTLTDGGTVSATRHFTVPLFSEVSPIAHGYVFGSEWLPTADSTGETTAAVQPAGGILIPSPGGSASGCSPADFTGFVAGRVALIQRGTCNFGVKVLNAEAAGASGVIIFNEGNTPARTGVITNAGLFDAGGNEFTTTTPVAFTSFAVGNDLYNQYLPVVHIKI
jgi:PA domain